MKNNAKMDGLQRLLDFIAYLKEQGILFSLHNRAPDTISIDFANIGIRYEVDFYVKEMRFSYMKGSEDVFTDEAELKRLIQEYWGDD